MSSRRQNRGGIRLNCMVFGPQCPGKLKMKANICKGKGDCFEGETTEELFPARILQNVQDEMVALRKETMEELVRGRIPTKELRTYIDKWEEIEHEAKKPNKSQLKKSFVMFFTLDEFISMRSKQNKIKKYMERSLSDHGPSTDSPHGAIGHPSSSYSLEELKKRKPFRATWPPRAEVKAKSEIEMSKSNAMANVERTTPRERMMPSQRETAESNVVTRVKGNVTNVVAGSRKVKFDMANISEAAREMVSLQTADVLPEHTSETQILSSAARENSPVSEIVATEIVPETLDESTLTLFTSRCVPTEEAVIKNQMSPLSKEKVDVFSAGNRGISPESSLNSRSSVQRMVRKLFQCIKDNDARSFGVYGQGGIGKTTMLKAFTDDPETKGMFDMIIWVTVSRGWSTRKIQKEIAKQLALGQEDFEADSDIARELFLKLEKQKFLLVLDDVWDTIDLDALGIPRLSLEYGSRLVMTTRFLKVCHDMDARELEFQCLSGEEAWELFCEQVGQAISYPDVQSYDRAIVNECGGLPLMIIVIARALSKEKDVEVWKHALKEFRLPGNLGMAGIESVIQQLKFCYQRLLVRCSKSHRLAACDVQTCFLYCALIPEDCEVSRIKLAESWIHEGLITGNSVDAQEKGQDIIDILLDGALLESKGGSCIKMHDVIRDLATRILSAKAEGSQFVARGYPRWTQLEIQGSNSLSIPIKTKKAPEGHSYLFRAGAGLKEPPSVNEWEQAKMIFLMDNDLSSLPKSPCCRHISALFLQRNYRLREIPASFFDSMPYLTILDLSRTRITSLPKSFSKLASLEELILRDCECLIQVPSGVGDLKHLKVLDLHGTGIYELPERIGEIASLRHLEVSFYGPVDFGEYSKLPRLLISPGIISRLLSLRTLSIMVYSGDLRWNKINDSFIKEISNLNSLTALRFYFPKVEHLQHFLQNSESWKGGKLKRFNFIVGHDVKRMLSRVPLDVLLEYNQQNQCLRFVNNQKVPDAAVVEVLARSTALYLDHDLKIRSLSAFGVRNMDGLEFCVVRECPEVVAVMDGEELGLPFLKHLSIHYLEKLERICTNPMPCGSFASLKHLCVHACPKLNFVVTSSICHCIYNLVELIVEDCRAITEIICVDTVVKPDMFLLPKLQKLTLHHLPKLLCIQTDAWPPLKHCSISNCPKLKESPYHRRLSLQK